MAIIPSNVDKITRYSTSRHKSFYYHYYSSDTDVFSTNVERWKGRNKELKMISEQITQDIEDWYRTELTGNEKDLSGTEFKDLTINIEINALDYCNLNFTTFESCSFIDEKRPGENHHEEIFFECKLNHSIFRNCKFENISFGAGEFQHIVFYNCSFNNVIFNKNRDGVYKNIFFQNCELKFVNWEKIKADSFCFWGECTFDNLIYSEETFPQNNIIGRDILTLSKKWDEETYQARKEIKYIGGPFNKIEIVYFKEGEGDIKIQKYSSMVNCYDGLARLYKNISTYEDKEGEHIAFLNFSFLNAWVKDQIQFITKGYLKNFKGLFSRYILGYGVRAERTLLALLSLTGIYAIIFIYTGLQYEGKIIKHDFTFHIENFAITMHDLLKSFYFTITSITSTGYGDVTPYGETTMVFAGFAQLSGVLLFTIFTVIFGRRFFK